jgi:hypothetical protein
MRAGEEHPLPDRAEIANADDLAQRRRGAGINLPLAHAAPSSRSAARAVPRLPA